MKKILVVDDDEDMLHLVKFILTSRGFDVHTHNTSINVAKIVKYYEPNLILLDIHLPQKLGTQICKELREVYTIPIILFSAYSDQRKAIECNADAFIKKPFDVNQLVDMVILYVN